MIKGEKRNAEEKLESQKKKLKIKKSSESTDGKSLNFKKRPFSKQPNEKPDWNKIKQEKKDLRIKRKKTNTLFDVVMEAKKVFEIVRSKGLKRDISQRTQSINKLHYMFVGKEQYLKLVFAHDTARIVQFLFKYGHEKIRNEMANELIPICGKMIQSKYGRNCFKSMLKYGNHEIRSAAIKKLYGNAIKFTSHLVTALVFEYAYSTWATTQQKCDFVQEFFGDIYKQVKDPNIKHLRDVYKNSPNMKMAALQATKANLSRVLNKDLLDSGLIQTVLCQYLSECSPEDKVELISQLAPHIVVISNSKDGVKAAMQCIWYGNNKDRKVIMKALKEHIMDLSMHEHGHYTVIALLDAVDDTVLLNKMILTKILSDVNSLVQNEHGRKILLWLIAPADSTHFHPLLINQLAVGRDVSTSKKAVDQRRQELLNYAMFTLANEVISNTSFWVSTASIAMVTLSIIKSAPSEFLQDVLNAIAKTITNVNWSIKKDESDSEILGVEHSGLHMILKKVILHDKVFSEVQKPTFSTSLLNEISDTTVEKWLTLNRGCFLFVILYENNPKIIREQLKERVCLHLKELQENHSSGAKLLLKKLQLS
ncbi:hypothetical protein FQA39_LY17072 [Lamprigera yunnana]|nr:hypothetical protein FQA39_LY17072 [Lamprigera yunnana]